MTTKTLLAPLFAIVLTGCPAALDDPGRFSSSIAGEEEGTSLASCGDVPTTIFASSCASAGCHAAQGSAASLDLESPGVEKRLVGVTPTLCGASGGGVLVNPSAPDQSLLYEKLLASPPCGSRMPLGKTPLDESQIACVRAWIGNLAASDGGASDGAPIVYPDAGTD